MATRLQFRDRLEEVLDLRNLYFTPPSGFKMEYDCCVYSISRRPAKHADNIKYLKMTCYECMLIFRDPDSDLPNKLTSGFQYCQFNRRYMADNLVHEVYLVYF